VADDEKPKKTRAANGESSIYLGNDGYYHGRVTMGIKDNGESDRRHVKRKVKPGKDGEDRARKEVEKEVSKLERERDNGTARKAGPKWTFERWLQHWLKNIVEPNVKYKGYVAYEVACRVHLIPGLGAHRLERLEPEHLEKFYTKMQASGSKPATAHQVHRTARAALGEAHRRGHVGRNVAALAIPPRLVEAEIPALPVVDMKRLIERALTRRNGVRYVVALAMGYRQGESLGLEWAQLDEELQEIHLREQIQRQKWQHGCQDPQACGERLHKKEPCRLPCFRHTRPCPPPCPPDCTKHASSCPERRGGGLVRVDVKSKASKRGAGVPDTLFLLLMYHKQAQEEERRIAGTEWQDHGLMFCQPNGKPVDPRRDLDEWKELLVAEGIDEARLHAARHSFATLLGQLQVTDRTAQLVMGWSDASQAKRYQKPNSVILRDVAERVEGAIFTDK
jgi:integrase